MRQIRLFGVALLSILFVVVAGCSSDEGELELSTQQQQEVADRLAPAGKVALEGETGSVAASSPSASSGSRSGQEIYDSKCMTCHTTGAAGAPMLGKPDQWASRITQGIETLYTHAISGIRGMPPKGLCMDCSDEEIHAAVDYMLDNSK